MKCRQLDNEKNSSVPGACKSYYSHEGKCKKGPRLHNNDKFKCPYNGKCRYLKYDNTVYEKECLCSGNDDGIGFCSLGQNDIDIKPV